MDERQHHYVVTYHYECDCGKVNYDEDAQSFDPHAFSGNKCRLCGYTKTETPTCDHAPEKTVRNSKYIAVDERQHHYVVTYHYECGCGKVNYDEDAQSFDPHAFSGNKCRLCGYTRTETPTCDHKTTKTKLSSKVIDDQNSDTTHFVVTTYRERCACGQIDRTVEEKQTVTCTFVRDAGVQAEHEAQGHQYFDRCECGNAKVNGRYTAYLSTCSVCAQGTQDGSLKRGMRGDRVEELQKMLGLQNVDGIFGGQTEAAVKEFQRSHGLAVTGVVDDATWKAIKNGQGASTPQEPQLPQEPQTPQDTSTSQESEEKTDGDTPENKQTEKIITASQAKQTADETFVADSEVKQKIKDLIDARNNSFAGDTINDVRDQGSKFNLGKALSQTFSEPTDAFFNKGLQSDAKDYLKQKIKDSLTDQAELLSLSDSRIAKDLELIDTIYTVLDKKNWKLNSKIIDPDDDVDVLATAALFLKVVDIGLANEADKRQIAEMINSYSTNVAALNSIYASSQDSLVKEACQELLSEIEAAKEGIIAESKRRGLMSVAELAASESFSVLMDAMPILSTVTGIVNLATGAENATFNNQDDMIILSYVRSRVSADLKQSLATGKAGTYDLFELYATIESDAYATTLDFYKNYADTVKGRVTSAFGNYNHQEVVEALKKEQNDFLIEYGTVRGMWNRHYQEATGN